MDEPICLAGYPRARDKLHPLLLQDLKMPQEEVMDSGDVCGRLGDTVQPSLEKRPKCQKSIVFNVNCPHPDGRSLIEGVFHLVL